MVVLDSFGILDLLYFLYNFVGWVLEVAHAPVYV
jgi:hypothetical protein